MDPTSKKGGLEPLAFLQAYCSDAAFDHFEDECSSGNILFGDHDIDDGVA